MAVLLLYIELAASEAQSHHHENSLRPEWFSNKPPAHTQPQELPQNTHFPACILVSVLPACGCYLEVKDAGVSACKALAVRNHPVEEVVVEGEGGDGGQQPAVP